MSNTTRYGVLIDGRRGGYGVVFPDLPGCTAMGRTLDEALRHAMEAAGEWAQAAAAPAPRRASRVHCGSSGRRCLHAGPGFEEGTPVAPAVAPAPVAARKCPPN